MFQRIDDLIPAACAGSICLGICQKIPSRIAFRAGERITCSSRSGDESRTSRPIPSAIWAGASLASRLTASNAR